MAEIHVREFFDEIRKTPARYTFSAFVLLIAYDLLHERMTAWANAKIDAGGGVMFSYMRDSLAWTAHDPATFIWSFVGVYALIVLTRAALKPSRPSSTPRMPTPLQSAPPLMPSLTTSQESSGRVAAEDARIFIEKSALELVAPFNGLTDYQAKKIVADYLNAWVRWSVSVYDVMQFGDTPSIQVIYPAQLSSDVLLPVIATIGFALSEKAKVIHLGKGTLITIEGQIAEVVERRVRLTNSRVIEVRPSS